MVTEADLLDRVTALLGKHLEDGAVDELASAVADELHSFAAEQAHNLRRLSEIGIALSSERDLNSLLESIVTEAQRFTNADAGTLYSVQANAETRAPELRFDILHNDSQGIQHGGTSGNEIQLPPIPMVVEDRPNISNVAAYVANTGQTVNIPDVYTAEGFDFTGPRKYDEMTGYRSQSMLVAPMRDHEDEIIGVLALMNAQDTRSGEAVPFSETYESLTESLASQAAISITNATLINNLQELFESLIKLVASAIDEKSAYTGGHIERVAGMTVKIAEAINEVTDGPYAKVSFTPDEMNELRIAAWLHDIGKITTPEFVVDKGTKLETIFDREDLLRTRFEVIRRGIQLETAERKIALLEQGAERTTLDAEDADLAGSLAHLHDAETHVLAANKPSEFLEDEKVERVREIATHTYELNGEQTPYLSDDELLNLTIRKGSLTESERQVINNHVSVTIKMLSQIPFPRKLSNVVQYAGAHHEKLNGTGYPNRLPRDKLALQSRILCLADICEALTARDRPYKEPMPLEKAFQILGFMVKDQEVDPDLYDLFVERTVYDRYMEEYEDKKATEAGHDKRQQDAELIMAPYKDL